MKPKKIQIPLENIQPGTTVYHEHLPADLIERIKNFKAILGDMVSASIEHTIENFKRDQNPEREVESWEWIAKTYAAACKKNPEMTPDERKDIYRTTLLASMKIDPIRVALE